MCLPLKKHDILKLVKDEDGKVYAVEKPVVEETKVELDEEEILRQLSQHIPVVEQLQKQLVAVRAFKAGSKNSDTITFKKLTNPVINPECAEQIAVDYKELLTSKEEVKE